MIKWSEYSLVDRIAIGALLVAAAVEILSLVRLPVEGYDTPNHLYWIESWHALWQQGVYYPRWLPNSFGGFGAPSFYFYPPLTYAVTSVLYWLLPGLQLLSIAKLFFVLTLAASGLTMWFYLHSRRISLRSSTLGSLLYLFAPYRFLDFNTRTAFSEHFAFVFLPIGFWAADRLFERKTVWRASGILVFTLVLLILTSLPSAATFFLALVVYAIASAGSQRLRNLVWLGALCSLAAMLTAFYLFPVAFFFHDVRLGLIWDATSIGNGNAIVALFNGESLRINLYNSISFLGAAVLLLFWWHRKSNVGRTSENTSFAREGWLLAMIVVLQLPYIPALLFYYIPPFKIVQLPPRLTLILLVIAATSWAARLDRPTTGVSQGSSWVVAGWSLAAAVLVLAQLAGLQVHKHYTLDRGDAPEYVPRWAPPYRTEFSGFRTGFDTSARIIWLGSQGNMLRDNVAPYAETIAYRSSDSAMAIVHRMYWPEWRVQVDGNTVPSFSDSRGRLSFPAPAGTHSVSLTLQTPMAAIVGGWCSLLTLAVLVLILIVRSLRERQRTA